MGLYQIIKENNPELYSELEDLMVLRTYNLVEDLFQTKFLISGRIDNYRSIEYNHINNFMMFDNFERFNRIERLVNSLFGLGYISKYDKDILSFTNPYVDEYNKIVIAFYVQLSLEGVTHNDIPLIDLLNSDDIINIFRGVYERECDIIKTSHDKNKVDSSYDRLFKLYDIIFGFEKYRLIDKGVASYVFKENNLC